jgi:hypothetical protein
MNCFAEFIKSDKTINKLRREVLWMGCDKTYPFNTIYVVYPAEKLRKGNIGQFFVIGIYVLTEERHFLGPVSRELCNLFDDFFAFSA